MSKKDVVWARFTWQLQTLELNLPAPASYVFRSAGRNEMGAVLQVVLSAYASDPVWKGLLNGSAWRMRERIDTTLGGPDSDYLVAEHQDSIVAVSGVAKSHWTDQNFLTGPCVVPGHQRKGLGRYLLLLSLMRLHEWGLSEARVYTEAGSLADRKVYPLFGSKREEGVDYPGVGPPPLQNREEPP